MGCAFRRNHAQVVLSRIGTALSLAICIFPIHAISAMSPVKPYPHHTMRHQNH